MISTIAGNGTSGYTGDGGPAIDASIGPVDLTVDAAGRVWFVDGNAVIRVLYWGTPVTGAPPRAVTGQVTKITSGKARVDGIVPAGGGSAVTERGVVLSTSPNPAIGSATKITAGSGSGRFYVSLTGLTRATTYHVRAYAVNAAGTAYGADMAFTTLPLSEHWTELEVAPPTGTVINLYRVFADGSKAWVLGGKWILFSPDYPSTPLAVQGESTTGSLSDFCFRRIDGKWSAWVVGGARAGFRTTDAEAGNWTRMSFSGGGNATQVSFPTDTIGYLTDPQGLMQKTVNGGQTWTVIPFPSDYTQRISLTGSSSMAFLDETTGYSVDAEPRIAITTDSGATWEDAGAAVAGAGNGLGGLCFPGRTLGWAVGNSGQILRCANGTWEDSLPNPDPGQRFLSAVHFSTDTDGWAVGSQGVMLHSTDGGSTWAMQNSGTSESLLDVFFTSPEEGYVVGANGTILRYSVVAPTIPAPALAIASAGVDSVVLSWPASATNLTLVATPRLGPGAEWTSVTSTPSLQGTSQVVTNLVSGAARFDRLQAGP